MSCFVNSTGLHAWPLKPSGIVRQSRVLCGCHCGWWLGSPSARLPCSSTAKATPTADDRSLLLSLCDRTGQPLKMGRYTSIFSVCFQHVSVAGVIPDFNCPFILSCLPFIDPSTDLYFHYYRDTLDARTWTNWHSLNQWTPERIDGLKHSCAW